MGIGDRPAFGQTGASRASALGCYLRDTYHLCSDLLVWLEFHEEKRGRPKRLIQFAEISLPKRLMICISYFPRPLNLFELFSSPSRPEDVWVLVKQDRRTSASL